MDRTTEYDPDSVQQLTKHLYRRATFVILLWPVIGVLAGGFGGLAVYDEFGAVMIGAIVGAFFGYLIGSMRSLYYQVQAQNALCLKQIEENTRRK